MTRPPKKKRGVPWVVTTTGSMRQKCMRCGAEIAIQLPMPISKFVKQANAFVDKHSECSAVPE